MFYMVVLKNSRKFPGKNPWQYILFNFTNKNTPPRVFSMGFSQIFQNTSRRLLLKLSRKVVLPVSNSTEAAIHTTSNKNCFKNCVSDISQIKLWTGALKHKQEGTQKNGSPEKRFFSSCVGRLKKIVGYETTNECQIFPL